MRYNNMPRPVRVTILLMVPLPAGQLPAFLLEPLDNILAIHIV